MSSLFRYPTRPSFDGTPNAEDLKKLQEWLDGQTAGLRKNKDDILAEKRTAEERFAKLQKDYEGLPEPKILRGLLDKIANDEEAKLLAEGKMDVVIDRRVDAFKKASTAQVEALTKRCEELERNLTGAKSTISGLKIDDSVRRTAEELAAKGGPKLRPTASFDLLSRAHKVFKLNDENDVVAIDGDRPMYSKDGKTPLSMAEWYEGLVTEAGHLFEPSTGGGSGGGPNGDRSSRRKDLTKIEAMTPSQKLSVGLQQAS